MRKYNKWITSLCISSIFICFTENAYAQDQDSIINVAFGAQNKEDVVGSVSTVNNDRIRKRTDISISNLLSGQATGLLTFQGNGEPGSAVSNFMIRGQGSYNFSSPLVFVDGYERDLNFLAIEEIESISILKDALATAQYGIRGANGVILITTKKGGLEGFRINTIAEYGYQTPTKLPKFIESYDYAILHNEALRNDGLENSGNYHSQEELDAYLTNSNKYLYPNVNWYEEILKSNAPLYQVGVDLSGGNKNVRYFTMLKYYGVDGLLKNTKFDDGNNEYNSELKYNRLNFRTNLDVNITKNLTASLNLGGIFDDRNMPATTLGSIFGTINNLAPYRYAALNPDGSLGGKQQYQNNPLGLVSSSGYTKYHDRSIQTTFQLTEKMNYLLKGLSISGSVAFDSWQRSRDNWSRSFAVYEPVWDGANYTYTQFNTDKSLVYSADNTQTRNTGIEGKINYDVEVNNSKIASMLLFRQNRYVTRSIEQPYSNQGFAGRFSINNKSKYLGEFSFGVNGSENFPKGKRFGFFPAVGGAWIISNERFLKSSNTVDYLKLRSTFGMVGNDKIGGSRFMYVQSYQNGGGYFFGNTDTWYGGIQEGVLANQNLTWEESNKFDLSIETHLFQKLFSTITYFNEKRSNILDVDYRSSVLGINTGLVNFGSVQNSGIELDLIYKSTYKDLHYKLGLNGILMDSEILKRNELSLPDNSLYASTIGSRLGQYYGYQAIGFFKDQQDIDNSALQTFGPVQPGDIKYKDMNRDGKIDVFDRTRIGNSTLPKYYYSFFVGLDYKQLSIFADFQGIAGNTLDIRGLLPPIGESAQISSYIFDRWTPDQSSNALYPRLSTSNVANNNQTASTWLINGDFLRLRSIEMSYQMPDKIVSKINLSAFKVFLRGANLFTYTNVKGVDPETMQGYPAMKSYTLGFKFSY